MKNGYTSMRDLRNTPVRDLTPEQCRKLLSHHHGGTLTPERRKAYLLKSAGDKWPAYFSDATEASRVQLWIQNEQMPLTRDEALADLGEDVAAGRITEAEAVKLCSSNPTPFLNRAEVKRFLLEFAAHNRAHKFTRVSAETLVKLNEAVRSAAISHIKSLPSAGKTI